ncbi:calcium/calmodulin-dependent 3',5'-cyclic nucleotide phosphodiesterase 1C-like isoform X1 [Arapaima gigas]
MRLHPDLEEKAKREAEEREQQGEAQSDQPPPPEMGPEDRQEEANQGPKAQEVNGKQGGITEDPQSKTEPNQELQNGQVEETDAPGSSENEKTTETEVE